MRVYLIVGLLCFLVFSAITLWAETLKDKITLTYDFYGDNSDNRVYAPSISLYKKLSEKFMIGTKLRVDAITSATASKGGAGGRLDAVTSATPSRSFEDMRYAPTLFGTYDDGDNSITVGGYYSTENDYKGKAIFANYNRQLNNQNTVMGISLSRSVDHWKPAIDRSLTKNNRNETNLNLSVTQFLSPTLSAQLTYSHILSEGFLSSPYLTLITDTFATFENYPESRSANAFAIRFVKLINEPTSINFTYRFYNDNWEINSHTFNLELYRDVLNSLTLGTRYRYYTQEKSNFIKDLNNYTLQDKYVAVDYRMSTFKSNTIGIMAIYKPEGKKFTLIDFSKVKIKGSADYYWTSKNDYISYWYDNNRLKGFFTSLSLDYEF